jgi:hypothetical protein
MGVAMGEPQHEQEVLLGNWQLRTLAPGENPCQEPEDFVDRCENQVENVQNGRDPA